MAPSETQGQRMLLMGCGSVGSVIAGGLLRAGHNLTEFSPPQTAGLEPVR